ncbi:BON domain-containing protein [Caldimonas sp. KR1-144]|uniref:BON domain-containing protein n=1 Tax=Caldimonas sp. KR1-144 TaxID=3400911 RepID=UPI003C0A7C22
MRPRRTLTALGSALALLASSACAAPRIDEPTGPCFDDAAITTAVRSRFIDNKIVDSATISVETMYGTVMLSGVARSPLERSTAEALSWQVRGVKSVRNDISLRR